MKTNSKNIVKSIFNVLGVSLIAAAYGAGGQFDLLGDWLNNETLLFIFLLFGVVYIVIGTMYDMYDK